MKKITLLFILAVESFLCLAQTVVEKEMLMIAGEQNGPSSSLISMMLYELNGLEEEEDFSYSIRYQERLREAFKGNTKIVKLDFDSIRIVGLKEPLFFNFEEEFFPSEVTIQVGVYQEDRPVRKVLFRNVAIENGKAKTQQIALKEDEKDVKVLAASFLYEEQQFNQVSRKVGQIEEYIASFYDLDALGLEMEAIEELMLNPKTMKEAKVQLDRLEVEIDKIKQREFWNGLKFKESELKTGYQLEALRDNVLAFLAFQQEKLGVMNQYKDELYTDLGLALYEKKKVDKALKYFKLAVEEKAMTPRANYMIGLIAFEKNDLKTAERQVKQLLNDFRLPDNEIRYEILNLAQQVFSSYLEFGGKAYQKQDFEQARGWFSQAESFCLNTIGVDCMNVEEWLEKVKNK